MNAHQTPQYANVVTWEEHELVELYRRCDDEWRGFVMKSAIAAAEHHNGLAPPGFVLLEGRAGGDAPPHTANR